MPQTAATRTTPFLVRPAAYAVGVAIAVILGTLVSRSASSWAPEWDFRSSSPSTPALAASHHRDPTDAPYWGGGAVTEKDGALPDGVTVFDDAYPGVAKLDPVLLEALQAAARDAGGRIAFIVNSGWRSPAYQDQLLRQAVDTYGSEESAARWVATAATSPHVAGAAVDVGADAAAWLSGHGAPYGLCQIYRNEPWHFELRPKAIARGCPSMFADPTRDPRMQ